MIWCFHISLSRISLCLVLFVCSFIRLFSLDSSFCSFLQLFYIFRAQSSLILKIQYMVYMAIQIQMEQWKGVAQTRYFTNICVYIYIYVLFLAPLSQCWANVVVVVNYKNCHFLQYLRRRCSVYTWMRLDLMKRQFLTWELVASWFVLSKVFCQTLDCFFLLL